MESVVHGTGAFSMARAAGVRAAGLGRSRHVSDCPERALNEAPGEGSLATSSAPDTRRHGRTFGRWGTSGWKVTRRSAIRFNIFHLNQTYRGDDARLNVGPAFTGENRGASYRDTEAYCLPLGDTSRTCRRAPSVPHNQLGKAIENAEKLGFTDGALHPRSP